MAQTYAAPPSSRTVAEESGLKAAYDAATSRLSVNQPAGRAPAACAATRAVIAPSTTMLRRSTWSRSG